MKENKMTWVGLEPGPWPFTSKASTLTAMPAGQLTISLQNPSINHIWL